MCKQLSVIRTCCCKVWCLSWPRAVDKCTDAFNGGWAQNAHVNKNIRYHKNHFAQVVNKMQNNCMQAGLLDAKYGAYNISGLILPRLPQLHHVCESLKVLTKPCLQYPIENLLRGKFGPVLKAFHSLRWLTLSWATLESDNLMSQLAATLRGQQHRLMGHSK